MSATAQGGLPPERKVVKSRDANISSPTAAHRASFGDLLDTVRKETGNPDADAALYSDPFGFRTRGPLKKNAVHYPSAMFSGEGTEGDGWDEVYKMWNDLRPGADLSLFEASLEIKKSLGRSSFSLPIFVSPDVYVSSGQNTPLADMVPRVAVEEDTIHADEQTAVGGVSSITGNAYPATTDDSYANHTYNVDDYGRKAEVTDFVQLSASSLRSTRQTTEEALMRAMRQYEEAQMIRGTNNDANGFNGFEDLIQTASPDMTSDLAGSTISVDDIYEANETLERQGANLDSVVHVTTHSVLTDLKKELDDFTRFESPGDELSFGFRSLMVDGQPVVKSHGVNATAGSRDLWSVDMSGWYMGMLQDATLHPLAKTDPTETFAVDAYGTLVGEGVNHLHRIQNVA